MTGTMVDRAARVARTLIMVGAMTAVSACTTQFRNHGYVPSEIELAQVQVGVDTRQSVRETIGTPTSGGVLNETGFYYVTSRFRHYAWLEPREISREVLAISFDDAGTVQNIERFGLEGGQVVALSRRVTDDNIRDTTFIRQLLGAIGNFDAGSLLAGDGG